jgi:hypothetical protein
MKNLLALWRDAMTRLDARSMAMVYADNCILEGRIFGTLLGRGAVEKHYELSVHPFWR